MKAVIPPGQIPEIMALVVPLASKARFGVDAPPLKEEHTLPKGVTLYCKSRSPDPRGLDINETCCITGEIARTFIEALAAS